MTINELLVKYLKISHDAALALIEKKCVLVNNVPSKQKQEISESDQVMVEGKEIQKPKLFRYVLYNKPRGVECTMNPEIPDSLLQVFPLSEGLFPVGRLDKESEGMLLLTDDGNLYRQIAGAEAHQEKEYEVSVYQNIPDEDLEQMAAGIEIMGQRTRPAKVSRINNKSFKIILTQGLNRQIRRMCYKLGYQVLSLKRIRIASLELSGLKEGAYRYVSKEDILPPDSKK